MSRKPTRADLEAQLNQLRKQRNAGAVAAVLINLIRWSAVCVICYFGYLSIKSLAGESTTADIGIKLMGDIRLSEVFAYLFGGGGVAYGYRQKKLRQNTVERLQGRNQTLEEKLDPHRTSSGITPRGETNPEDVI